MANYLYLLGPHDRLDRIARRFSPQDHRVVRDENGLAELFVATDVAETTTDCGYFKGYAIDHRRRAIVFGGRSIDVHPAADAEGCFVSVVRDGQIVSIQSDWFGLMPRLYFGDGGVVAVSDSLMVLTTVRRWLDLPVRIDEAAVASRAWGNGASDQLHQEQTPIVGVRYCLPTAKMEVDIRSGSLRIEVPNPVFDRDGTFERGEYVDALRDAATRIGSVVAAFAELRSNEVALALSGGLDSRVVLAALRRSGHLRDIGVRCNPSSTKDFEIARLVTNAVGVELNRKQERPTGLRRDRCTLWGMFNAGVYDPLFSPHLVHLRGGHLTLGGHGSELCKGTYRWKTLESVARDAGAARSAYSAAVAAGLRPLGLSPNDRWSSEWYNYAYRSPLHCGRFIMSGTVGVRPLLDRRLVALARSAANPHPAPRPASTSIITDLLIVLDPGLTLLPFAKPIVGLDVEHLGSRSAALGVIDPPTPYAVVGEADQMPGGVPDPLVEAACERGFVGGLEAATLQPLVERSWDRIDSGLRALFQPIRDSALSGLSGPIRASAPSSRAAGKLLTFLLAD